MGRILAVDPGRVHTGWAIIENGQAIEWGTFSQAGGDENGVVAWFQEVAPSLAHLVVEANFKKHARNRYLEHFHMKELQEALVIGAGLVIVREARAKGLPVFLADPMDASMFVTKGLKMEPFSSLRRRSFLQVRRYHMAKIPRRRRRRPRVEEGNSTAINNHVLSAIVVGVFFAQTRPS
jgi:hypothetical protein